ALAQGLPGDRDVREGAALHKSGHAGADSREMLCEINPQPIERTERKHFSDQRMLREDKPRSRIGMAASVAVDRVFLRPELSAGALTHCSRAEETANLGGARVKPLFGLSRVRGEPKEKVFGLDQLAHECTLGIPVLAVEH